MGEQKRRKDTKVHGVTENTQERKVVAENQDIKAPGLGDARAPLLSSNLARSAEPETKFPKSRTYLQCKGS